MLFDGPYRFPKKPKEPKVELEFPKRWWDSTPKIEIDIKKKKKYTFKYTRKWSYIHDYQPKHSWIKYNIFYTTKANWVLVVYNFYSRKNIFWEKNIDDLIESIRKSSNYDWVLKPLIKLKNKLYPPAKEIIEL